MAKKTKPPKSPAAPPFKITVPLPTTQKKKAQGVQSVTPFKKPKKKQKLTEEQKKNVEKGATVMEKQDIPGTPHFRMVPKKAQAAHKLWKLKVAGLLLQLQN